MRRILQLIFITISLIYASESFAEKPFNFNESLNEFLKEASGLKDSAVQKATDPKYDPRTKIDGYTDQPKEIGHYHEDGSDSAGMETEAAVAVKPGLEGSTAGNAGQAVIHSFKKRPVYKLTWEDADIQKAKQVEDHPKKHVGKVTLDINSKTNCEKKKTTKCEETFSEKTCTEQVRALVKVCEKVPKIATGVKEMNYPNCASVVVARAFRGCPSGYSQIAHSDMIQHESHDDVLICHKTANQGESSECYGGYLIYSAMQATQNTKRAVVPKKTHGRLRFSDFQDSIMVVTIVNETTGQAVYNNGHFSDGQVVELPYSETQDQVFRFDELACRGWGCRNGIGVMVLYFDRTYREEVANVEGWQEVNCSEI